MWGWVYAFWRMMDADISNSDCMPSLGCGSY